MSREPYSKTNDRDVMREFVYLLDRDGVPPSIRELQEYANLSSTSVTLDALRRLAEKGWVRKAREADNRIHRNYLPTKEGRDAVSE